MGANLKQKLMTKDLEEMKYTGIYCLGRRTKVWAKWIAWFQIITYNICMSVHLAKLVMIIGPILQKVNDANNKNETMFSSGNSALTEMEGELNFEAKISTYCEISQAGFKLLFATVQFALGIILLQGVGKENEKKVSVWTVGTITMTLIYIAFIVTTFITGAGFGFGFGSGSGSGSGSGNSYGFQLLEAGQFNLYIFALWHLFWIFLTINFLWVVSAFKRELCLYREARADFARIKNKSNSHFDATMVI